MNYLQSSNELQINSSTTVVGITITNIGVPKILKITFQLNALI